MMKIFVNKTYLVTNLSGSLEGMNGHLSFLEKNFEGFMVNFHKSQNDWSLEGPIVNEVTVKLAIQMLYHER